MTDLDPLEQTLEHARAALAPSFADDALLRRALGLEPAGALPTASEAQAAAQPAAARQVAEPRAVEPRPAASRAGVIDLRAWRALRASGSAGILAGAVLAGLSFGAGLWLGRADVGVAAQPLGEPPASIGHAQAPARGPLPPAGAEPRAAIAHEDGNQHGAEANEAILEAAEANQANEAGEDVERATPGDVLGARRARPAPHVESSPRRDSRTVRRAPSRAHATASSGTNEELALLRRVERALRAGNPALALALIGELDQSFPETRLGEEREAARVIASCGVGEGGARSRAERFSRAHDGSVYSESVREACAIREGSTRSEGSMPSGDQ